MHVSIKLWVETCNFIIKENPTEVFSCEFLQNKTPPSDCFFNSISRFESSVNLNFLAFLGKVNEPPILLLRHESVKVRTYAETCSGRYSYHQLLLEFPRFTMKISRGNTISRKSLAGDFIKLHLFYKKLALGTKFVKQF